MSFLGRACAVSLFLAMAASAQEEPLEGLIVASQVAMKEKNWERALEFNTRAITRFGGGQAFRDYGAQFGIIYYRKGLCELKLKRWKDAMLSFETCYRDFPNPGKENANPYQKMALRKWAEAAMGDEQWELALARFSKFIAERDKLRDTFPQGSYYINLAICHYKLGHIAQGSENLEIAIRNKANFPTPDLGIIAGFQALVSAVIASGNEQALVDFIGKNRGALMIAPYRMYRFSPVFMKLAGDAIAVGMRRAAMDLYQFIPSTDVAIDDVRARLKSMGAAAQVKDGGDTLRREDLETDLATFEADRRGKRATETIKLAAVAFLHEASGNFLGAYAAYQQLEMYWPGAEKREDNLFNLIRVAARVGMAAELRVYADTFQKAFPESGRSAEVRRFVLSSLLDEGDPVRRIAVAEPVLGALAQGTPEHELCLYLLGMSYFNTGAHDKAGELLDLHVKLYPEGGHAAAAAYYQASNAARLRHWEKSASLFDAFLADHPDSPYLASALYERAACHFEAGQPDAAREDILRLIASFPQDPIIAPAHLLLGNIEMAAGKPGDAEKAYQKSFDVASGHPDKRAAGDALCALVELLGRAGSTADVAARMKAAVGHADLYWKKFAEGSPCQKRVAVAQVRAFVRAGRGEEALDRLRGIVAKGAAEPGGNGALIDSYAEAFLASHSPEELAKQFEDFPGMDPANRSTLARLRMAVIGAYESEAREAKDEPRRREAEAMVKSLYQKLKADFTPKELDTRTLIRLGDHLRVGTSTPREALVFYDEAIGREDTELRMPALLGRADVRARSADPAEIGLGIDDFQRVYTGSAVEGERGYALFRIVEARMAKGDFAKAIEEGTLFLDSGKSGLSEFAPQVGLMLARCYQELGRADEAIGAYARVWSAHTEDLRISAPAMTAWVQLLWTRNRENTDPSDRQAAYEGAVAYLEKTRGLTAALNEEDLGQWREIENAVKTFGTSPGIKPVGTRGK